MSYSTSVVFIQYCISELRYSLAYSNGSSIESLMDSPYCRWWKDDLGYHNEHHLFTGYVQGSWDGICPECGKKIEYLKVK